jgi:hypothetical protein
MIKRIDKSVPCLNVEGPGDLEAARQAIRAAR